MPVVVNAIESFVAKVTETEPGSLMYTAWQQEDDQTRFTTPDRVSSWHASYTVVAVGVVLYAPLIQWTSHRNREALIPATDVRHIACGSTRQNSAFGGRLPKSRTCGSLGPTATLITVGEQRCQPTRSDRELQCPQGEFIRRRATRR